MAAMVSISSNKLHGLNDELSPVTCMLPLGEDFTTEKNKFDANFT